MSSTCTSLFLEQETTTLGIRIIESEAGCEPYSFQPRLKQDKFMDDLFTTVS